MGQTGELNGHVIGSSKRWNKHIPSFSSPDVVLIILVTGDKALDTSLGLTHYDIIHRSNTQYRECANYQVFPY